MYYKSIKRVSDSYLCSNCGACKVVCPKEAIEFRTTNIGRVYAQVNENCINCGQCQNVCPSLAQIKTDCNSIIDPFIGKINSVYVGRAINSQIFQNSQSGGVCTAILNYLFDSKKIDAALVCCMEFGEPVPEVKSIVVTSSEELSNTQKSCYTPVELLSILKQSISQYFSVAIVGIGCHIEGISAIQEYQKKFRERIYCKIGLICDRTLCGTIQDAFASYTPKFNKIKINWRCKYIPTKNQYLRYETAPLIISNEDGHYKILPNYYRFALKEMFTPPRCRVCSNKLNTYSDITLGDPWRMPNIDLEKGESVIASRTEKGEEILTLASQHGYLSLSKRPVQQLINGQLIGEKKKQVASFSKAFIDIFKPTISSKLLNLNERDNKNDLIIARNIYKKFIILENSSKGNIIKEARKLIQVARLKNTIIFKIIRKIYKVYENSIKRSGDNK